MGEWSAARPGRTLPRGKDPVPILQEAGRAPVPVWTGGKSRPHRDSIPDRPARSQQMYEYFIIKLLAPELFFFLILAHPVYKM